VVSVSSPNQREFLLERKRKENPPVTKLKKVAKVVIEESIHYDVRAAYQAKLRQYWRPDSFDHLSNPRSGSVDERTGFKGAPSCRQQPVVALPDGSCKFMAGKNGRATLRRTSSIKDDDPRVVCPAVAILEGTPAFPQCVAGWMVC
jgi:hypothetical protein